MSDFTNNFEEQPVISIEADTSGYEVISSDEVDKIVSSLEQLMSRVQSENIRAILDEAADAVYGLIYSDAMDEAEAA